MQPVRRDAGIHSAFVLAMSDECLPIRQFVAPRPVRVAIKVVDQARSVAAGQVPSQTRVLPVNPVDGFGLPNGRTVVVPDAIFAARSVRNDRHVRLRHAERFAVQHGLSESAGRANVTLNTIERFDDLVVQEEFRSNANLRRRRVRRAMPIVAASDVRQDRRNRQQRQSEQHLGPQSRSARKLAVPFGGKDFGHRVAHNVGGAFIVAANALIINSSVPVCYADCARVGR